MAGKLCEKDPYIQVSVAKSRQDIGCDKMHTAESQAHSHGPSQPSITGVDRWSTTINWCSVENFPRPIVKIATPAGVISLPSALINLTVCMGL